MHCIILCIMLCVMIMVNHISIPFVYFEFEKNGLRSIKDPAWYFVYFEFEKKK